MITYCRNKENSFPPETKQEYHLSSISQQNLSSLSSKRENQTTLGNQAEDSVPKICAIFSLKNESKINSGKEMEGEEEEEEKEEDDNDEKEEQIGGGIFEEVAEGEDEESIEEFDPEDPALLEDEEEEEEDEDEDEEEEKSEASRSPATVYKYDISAKSYVRLEKSEEGVSMKSGAFQTSESKGENQREGMRQPNILKRKLVMPTVMTKNGAEDEIRSIVEEHKVQKLDTNNSPVEEDGIMYVTVKGSKPNEFLLVKVSE